MNQLIEDLLTLSRLESVNYVPRFTEINMKKFVDRVIKDFAELIERKNISIHCKVPKEIVIVSDEKMLYAVLKNLIDNGIKYNKEGGVLKITVKEIEDFVEIVVEDTGIGIPKSHLPFIFERFYRVERSRSKRFGGTGLGLSIVKLAVEKLGGTVEVESEEGKGSKFKVTLPKEPVYSSKTTTLKPLAEK
jgi:two-component system phosphate regulon sensor histidine kinase PhoR